MKRHLGRRAILIASPRVALPPGAGQRDGKRGFVWDDRPSIVFGEDISVDLTGRALLEWRKFDPDIGEDAVRPAHRCASA